MKVVLKYVATTTWVTWCIPMYTLKQGSDVIYECMIFIIYAVEKKCMMVIILKCPIQYCSIAWTRNPMHHCIISRWLCLRLHYEHIWIYVSSLKSWTKCILKYVMICICTWCSAHGKMYDILHHMTMHV